MTNAQTIYTYLTGKGLSPAAASGVLGNLAQESSLDPNANGGYLAQWQGSRLQGLNQYAISQGTTPANLNTQLGFLYNELASGNYVSIQRLNQMTPTQAALYISNNYEKPLPAAANNTGREQYANEYYQQFTGNAPPTAPQGSNQTNSQGQLFSGISQLVKQVFFGIGGIAIVVVGLWLLFNPAANFQSFVKSNIRKAVKS